MKQFWKVTKMVDDSRLAKQSEPEGIEKVCDIPYIDDGSRMHLLDVYYPENRVGNLPVIIDVHGGGWMYGDKELNKIYCLNLAKRGFVVFNMSYRLVPEVTVNEEIQDVMCALNWISKNMANYPCDTNNIMLTGDSAGGHLAALAVALMTSEKLREIFDTVDCEMKLTALTLTSPVAYMNLDSGIMSVYSKAMWGKDYRKKRTYPYMNLDSLLEYATYPPTLMITSSGDFMALEQTRKAAADFKSRGFSVELMDFPKFDGVNLPHVFSVLEPESIAGNIAIDRAVAMFREEIAKKQNVKAE